MDCRRVALIVAMVFCVCVEVVRAQGGMEVAMARPVDAVEPRPIDVLSYVFRITVTDRSDTITGIAQIRVKFLKSVDSLQFDLASVKGATGKGMRVTTVQQNGKGVTNYGWNDKLTIRLKTAAKAGSEAVYLVGYRGVPIDGLIISKNKFGQRTFFADNWPNRAHNWIPCVDDPADKASVEFIVTAPDHYRVVANGIPTQEVTRKDGTKITGWKEIADLPTKVMVIGLADFAVQQSGMAGNIPVSTWVFASNKDKGFADYAVAPEILEWMMNYIGTYGYQKLANVQSKTIFGGMENAGAIFYYENSVNGKKNNEELFAHEIAHQFFGDMATEESFPHVWLSEGFATYMTHLYIESKYGADSLAAEMKTDRAKVIQYSKKSQMPVVDEYSPLMDLLNPNSYEKGSWVLHMLRSAVGDVTFHKSIRAYYAKYAGKNANTDDLQHVFEEQSGMKLDTFFHQWLEVGGQPQLEVGYKYDSLKSVVHVSVKQLQKDVFVFPLELKFTDKAGKSVVVKIPVDAASNERDVEVGLVPVKMELDPGVKLLFERKVGK